jgi:PEP-CTERM motif
MRNRAFRPIIAALSILLLTHVPTQAGPVIVSDVIQVLSNHRNPPDLRIRTISQNPSTAISSLIGPNKPAGDVAETSVGTLIIPTSNSLISGIAIDQDPKKVDVVVQGDVEATICDCGDIEIPVGGFPKWPLLFLGAIPFLFLDNDDETPVPPLPTGTPFSLPTPTPPIVTVPEPATLLLFASGLSAFGVGLRRRYSRSKSVRQIHATEGD